MHDAHAAAAAAAGGLDDHRVADRSRAMRKFSSGSLPSGPPEPGTHGTPDAFMRADGRHFVAHHADGLGFGPTKMKPLFSTRSAKSAFSDRKP